MNDTNATLIWLRKDGTLFDTNEVQHGFYIADHAELFGIDSAYIDRLYKKHDKTEDYDNFSAILCEKAFAKGWLRCVKIPWNKKVMVEGVEPSRAQRVVLEDWHFEHPDWRIVWERWVSSKFGPPSAVTLFGPEDTVESKANALARMLIGESDYPPLRWIKKELAFSFYSNPKRIDDVIAAYVVGSRARGTSKPNSDLDIAVVINPRRGLSALQFTDRYHAGFTSDTQKPKWNGIPVDFQFFYPNDPELNSYSKLAINESATLLLGETESHSLYAAIKKLKNKPKFTESFEVLLEGFRGWVSPSGEKFYTSDGVDHGDHADKLLAKKYPSWKWEDDKRFSDGSGAVYATDALEAKGWIRVVDDGIYSCWALDGRTRSTLIELISEIDDGTPVMVDSRDGKGWFRRGRSKDEALDTLIDESALSESEHDLMVDFEDLSSEFSEEYSRGENPRQSWKLVPADLLKKVWMEYGKYGRVDEDGINRIWDILKKSAVKVLINSALKDGEWVTLLGDYDSYQDVPDEEWTRFFNFISDQSGSDVVRNMREIDTGGNGRYSDASQLLKTLVSAAYRVDNDPEKLLGAIDRILNFAHGLGNMAKWFVQGGVHTLDEIADYAPKGATMGGFRETLTAAQIVDALLETTEEKEVFHGTRSEIPFETFDPDMEGTGIVSNGSKKYGGFFFTSDFDNAQFYTEWFVMRASIRNVSLMPPMDKHPPKVMAKAAQDNSIYKIGDYLDGSHYSDIIVVPRSRLSDVEIKEWIFVGDEESYFKHLDKLFGVEDGYIDTDSIESTLEMIDADINYLLKIPVFKKYYESRA